MYLKIKPKRTRILPNCLSIMALRTMVGFWLTIFYPGGLAIYRSGPKVYSYLIEFTGLPIAVRNACRLMVVTATIMVSNTAPTNSV